MRFESRGTLFREFDETFSAVFGRRTSSRGAVLRMLAEAPLSVVEIKRRKEIGSGVMDEVKAKVDALGVPRGLSVRTALVYDGKLSPAIESERYFDFIVDAKAMLREV